MTRGSVGWACAAALVAWAALWLPVDHAVGERSSRPLRIALGGDVMLARGVAQRASRDGWNAVLTPLRDLFGDADLSIVNLESPLGPCLQGGTVARPRLCMARAALDALVKTGVDAVTLANNHALDGGARGLASTARALRDRGVVPLGVAAAESGRLMAETIGEVTVIAANLTRSSLLPARSVPIPAPDEVARLIRAHRVSRDPHPILVLLHAGVEHRALPSDTDWRYAEAARSAGASAVIMHGAHVLRPLVVRDATPIHFGLGNLVFDQRQEETRVGAVLTIEIGPDAVARVASTQCVRALRVVPCPDARGAGRASYEGEP